MSRIPPQYTCLTSSFNDRYDAEPFTYEEEELEPPPPEDDIPDETQLPHLDNTEQNGVNGIKEHTVVASGDVTASTPSSKAIPPEQRSTTPYMTKYEKARILGTRALQIRYLSSL
jgi:hypothetical protein